MLESESKQMIFLDLAKQCGVLDGQTEIIKDSIERERGQLPLNIPDTATSENLWPMPWKKGQIHKSVSLLEVASNTIKCMEGYYMFVLWYQRQPHVLKQTLQPRASSELHVLHYFPRGQY